MTWLYFIIRCVVVSFAAKAAVTAWLEEGGICDGPREWFVAFGELEDNDGPPSRWELFRSRIAQLATCRLCLGYHTAFWIYLLTLVGDAAVALHGLVEMTPTLYVVLGGLYWLATLPVLSLAATGIYQYLVSLQDWIDERIEPTSGSWGSGAESSAAAEDSADDEPESDSAGDATPGE